jgi:hypothetical protein
MPKEPKAPTNANDPAQSQRFIDMAREIEATDEGDAFDRTFNRVAQSKAGTRVTKKPPEK